MGVPLVSRRQMTFAKCSRSCAPCQGIFSENSAVKPFHASLERIHDSTLGMARQRHRKVPSLLRSAESPTCTTGVARLAHLTSGVLRSQAAATSIYTKTHTKLQEGTGRSFSQLFYSSYSDDHTKFAKLPLLCWGHAAQARKLDKSSKSSVTQDTEQFSTLIPTPKEGDEVTGFSKRTEHRRPIASLVVSSDLQMQQKKGAVAPILSSSSMFHTPPRGIRQRPSYAANPNTNKRCHGWPKENVSARSAHGMGPLDRPGCFWPG